MYTFLHVTQETENCVKEWLGQDFVAEWFYGVGLANTLNDLAKFTAHQSSLFIHWLAYDSGIPFAYLMTSKIEKDDEYAVYGEGITLDLLIGNRDYLGKGFAHRLIQTFLLSQFPDENIVLIDPEASNARAIHVYEKAGFKIVDKFIPKYDPTPHVMMRLDMNELKR